MPRSDAPRKRHGRRVDPGYLLRETDITHLAMIPHMALEKLNLGLFGDEDWMNYGVFANVIQLIAQEVGNHEVLDLGKSTALALHGMRQRAERIKRWGCNSAELLALRAAINPMDDFLRTCTNVQIQRAMKTLDAAMAEMQAHGVGLMEKAA